MEEKFVEASAPELFISKPIMREVPPPAITYHIYDNWAIKQATRANSVACSITFYFFVFFFALEPDFVFFFVDLMTMLFCELA